MFIISFLFIYIFTTQKIYQRKKNPLLFSKKILLFLIDNKIRNEEIIEIAVKK